MAFTYDAAISTSRDKVRFLVGDTDSTEPQLDDGEIAFLLSEQPNVYRAAALAAETLAAKYARLVDKRVGDLSLDASQKQAHYLALAASLTAKALARNVAPVATGLSQSTKRSDRDDVDLVQPWFRREMQMAGRADAVDVEEGP